jgi:hypothetical protein
MVKNNSPPRDAELSKLGKRFGLGGLPSLVKEGWLRHKEDGPVP